MDAESVAGAVSRLEPDLIRIRRDLHRHPELGFHEQRSATIVAERMAALGLDLRTGVGGTGVVADLVGESGPMVLIRADMDAISVTERTGLAYASVSAGVMHACGHDAHVSSAIGAATILAGLPRVAGTIRFCFQPAEELLAGGRRMIEEGAMDGVGYVLGAHVLSGLAFGSVSVSGGPFLAGGDLFEIRVTGEPGHGAMPHLTVDPVLVAAHVVTALQSVVARETRPGEPVVLSVNTVHGGSAPNVAVEEVTLGGTIRWFSPAERERVLDRVEAIARAVGEGLRARIDFKVVAGAPITTNTPEVAGLVADAVAATGRAVPVRSAPITATDDFACFLERAPGAFFGVGAGGPGAATHHHPAFTVDERAIALTTEVLVGATRRLLDVRPMVG